MEVIKKIGQFSLLGLSLVSVLVMVCWAYYKIFVNDFTIGINIFGDQTGLDIVDAAEAAGDEYEPRILVEANYYSNDKKNGVKLREMKLNYFLSPELNSDVYSAAGMQLVGNQKLNGETGTEIRIETAMSSDKFINNNLKDTFYYYNTAADGMSFVGDFDNRKGIASRLKSGAEMIVRIDKEPYLIKFGKVEVLNEEKVLGVTVSKTSISYSPQTVFSLVMNAIETNSKGYGSYYIPIDLSNFIEVFEYNKKTKKWSEDSVTDIVKNYAVVKFSYFENGARSSSQSIFGDIAQNPKYKYEASDTDTTYSQERVLFELTEKDLRTRFDDMLNGQVLYLNHDLKFLVESIPRRKIVVKIDLNNTNIVGLDYNAFDDFELDTLQITGLGDFHLLSKSLHDTQIKTIKRSSGVNLIITPDAINSVYSEVIL